MIEKRYMRCTECRKLFGEVTSACAVEVLPVEENGVTERRILLCPRCEYYAARRTVRP